MMVFSFYTIPSFVSYREKSGLDIKKGIFILYPWGMGEPFTLNGHTPIYCSSPVSFSRFIIHTARVSSPHSNYLINDCCWDLKVHLPKFTHTKLRADEDNLWVENWVFLQWFLSCGIPHKQALMRVNKNIFQQAQKNSVLRFLNHIYMQMILVLPHLNPSWLKCGRYLRFYLYL